MSLNLTNGLEYHNACRCAGTGCGGHLVLGKPEIREADITPIGYQGAVQHTYTPGCAGFHEPGPCPQRQQPVIVHVG